MVSQEPRPDAADSGSRRQEAEEVSPDVDALRRKYFGRSNPGTSDASSSTEPEGAAAEPAAETDSADDEDTEDQIVAVEPEAPADPWDQGSRAKTVVVSGKDRKVIGTQG